MIFAMITSDMPQIEFGKHSVSRLIVGANTINGGSHLSRFVNMQMKHYFTPNKILEHLSQCQNSGINTWQSVSGNLNWYRMLQEQGANMHFISLGWDTPDEPDMLENLASAGTIGIAHHGEITDTCYKSGKIHLVEEYCKKVRDSGMMVGVSTHMPDVLKHILNADWDVDFFYVLRI